MAVSENAWYTPKFWSSLNWKMMIHQRVERFPNRISCHIRAGHPKNLEVCQIDGKIYALANLDIDSSWPQDNNLYNLCVN